MSKKSPGTSRNNSSDPKSTFKREGSSRPGKAGKPFKKNYDGRSPGSGSSGGGGGAKRPYSGRTTDTSARDSSERSERPAGRSKPAYGKDKPFGDKEGSFRKPRTDFDGTKRAGGEGKPYGERPKGRPGDRGDASGKSNFHRNRDESEPRREFKKPYSEGAKNKRFDDRPKRDSADGGRTEGRPSYNKDNNKTWEKRESRKEFGKSSSDRPQRGSFADKRGARDNRQFNPDDNKGGENREPRKDFDRSAKPPKDSRPFRDRPKTLPARKPGHATRPDFKKDKDAGIEEKEKGFSSVMDHAFNKTKSKKGTENNEDDPSRPRKFEDQVFGALEEETSAVKHPFAKGKPAGSFGKKKHFHDHSEGRKKNVEEDDFEEDDKKISQKHGPHIVMPLNKFIAHSGECSRRDAAELVRQGKVKVNGELVLDPGYKVAHDDKVTMSGKKLTPQKGFVYILLNKPKGFITTTDDPQGRRTVMELVGSSGVDRLFPVGRLDRNTSGLLLITNDGDLTQKLSHPAYNIKKVYQVTLDRPLTKADFDQILEGIELEDGMTKVDSLAYLEKKNELGLEIHSGKNRIVRRIFESLKYEVEKLDRVMYAGLTKKNLPRSKWRYLDEREVVLLKHFKS